MIKINITMKHLLANTLIGIAMIALLLPSVMQAQAETGKPSLVVFVVGMDRNEVGDFLAILIGNELGGGDKYEIITRTEAVQKKLRELRDYENSGNVSDSELIEWGRQNNVSMLCLVTSIKLDEYMFAAQLTDVKSNKLVGSGDYSSASLGSAELKKTAAMLAEHLQGVNNGSTPASSSSSGSKRNGEIFNPDGIEMVCVAGTGSGITATKGFYIGKYEVTQGQWKAIMGNNPSNFSGDNLPVEMVSWNDVQEFISRLNAATGRQYRLPAESEWEFAARGGNANSFCPGGCEYSGSNNIGGVAWYTDNSGSRTHPVGTKSPNELGIYDMSGNVWEWCEDWYDSSHLYRVLRGGSWDSYASSCRVSFRADDSPGSRYNSGGFRLALSL
jgi:hypothetical protein